MKKRFVMSVLAISMLLTACGNTDIDKHNIIMLDFGGQTGTYKVTMRPFSTDAVWVPFEIVKKEAGRLAGNLCRYKERIPLHG